LSNFTDQSAISPNLRKYVAAAVEQGIMEGSNKTFKPQSALSRAEAATLLAKLIVNEKVTYDKDVKVTYDAIEKTIKSTPTLYSVIKDGRVYLEWSKVLPEGFKYYKVVLSQNDSTPSYPDQGYMVAISNSTTTKTEIKAGSTYNNGDLGGLVKAGESYYVAITAVYENGSYTSNVREVKVPVAVPSALERTPVLNFEMKDKGVLLKWSKVSPTNFIYYKIVFSKNDDTPSYPDNGYLTYISDVNGTEYFVQEAMKYNKGDMGGYVDDETYYVTITAVYKDGKYTSQTKTISVPDK
jgi:hypothetical protein